MIQEYDPEDSPYSFGTTPIYNSMYKTLTSVHDETDIVVINMSAIIRNVSGKTNLQQEYKDARDRAFPFNIVAQDIAKQSLDEIKLLVNDTVQMMNSKKSSLPRYIYVYMGDNSKIIPAAYQRPAAPGKQHIDMAEAIIRDKYKNSRTETELDGIKVIELYSIGRVSVFRNLEKEIRYFKNQHNVVMVSNHPIDYHLYHYVGRWCNIKSYTGVIQHKDDLGDKVFGHSFLPFTERLHILLGDKTDMKPCINHQAKKTLLDVAEKESWNLKSTEFTDKRLGHLNYITPYVI